MSNQINKTRIKDIAALANVSAGTVDRVLHNRGEVAEETRQQVLSIINKMGYTPNVLAKSLASKKSYKIAVLIPDYANDNPYWEKPLNGIRQAINEIKDFNAEVIIFNFDLDNEVSFVSEYTKLREIKPDGLIFSPFFLNVALKIVSWCEKETIPYIFIDINLEDKKNIAYFGQNAFQSGYLAAKLMEMSLGDDSEILILKLAQTATVSQHLINREAGFFSFFNTNKLQKIKLIAVCPDLNQIDGLSMALDQEFLKSDHIKGIFVTNSKVYKVAEYLFQRKISNILLVGYDLIEQNLHFLDQGIITFLIGQKPEDQGYKSVMEMFNHLLFNKKINKVNYVPLDIIMKENVDFYKNLN